MKNSAKKLLLFSALTLLMSGIAQADLRDLPLGRVVEVVQDIVLTPSMEGDHPHQYFNSIQIGRAHCYLKFSHFEFDLASKVNFVAAGTQFSTVKTYTDSGFQYQYITLYQRGDPSRNIEKYVRVVCGLGDADQGKKGEDFFRAMPTREEFTQAAHKHWNLVFTEIPVEPIPDDRPMVPARFD